MRNLNVCGQVAVVSAQMGIAMAIMLFACATVAEGQPPFAPATVGAPHATLNNVQPYYPPAPVYHAPPPCPPLNIVRHASTAAEGFARGHAAAVSAHGYYNLMTAQARVVHAEAASREIDNREKWIDSYFAMREKNRQERALARGPRPTLEQLERIAAAGRPAPLSPSELNTTNGAITWPTLLRKDEYGAPRAALESVFAHRAVTGQLHPDAPAYAKEAADAMLAQLRERVREVPQQDYIAARRFIESLAYAVRRPAS
jgi:hypothetical protein